MSEEPSFILASASPRRVELLAQIGWRPEVIPAHIDEGLIPGECPQKYVRRIAQAKAMAVAAKNPGRVVLGADTTVVCGGKILSKPADDDDARAMLSQLSGGEHQVWTGVCVAHDKLFRCLDVMTRVRFRVLADADISAYIATGEPMDKAGSYAIQGYGAVFVKSIAGSYSAVMGLPLFESAALLIEFGVSSWLGVTSRYS